MESLMRRSVLILMLLNLLALATSVQAQGIRWAGDVDPPTSLRVNILHAPDNRYPPLVTPLTIRRFGPTMNYPGLSILLGIPLKELEKADIIAFEANGGSGAGLERGWESSLWTFTDGTNRYVVKFNELVGRASDPAVLATGSIRGVGGSILRGGMAYSKFFGMCCPDPRGLVVSYILFDLDAVTPAVDVRNPTFSITIANGFVPDGSFGEGTPDPDAIGIVTKCTSFCPIE